MLLYPAVKLRGLSVAEALRIIWIFSSNALLIRVVPEPRLNKESRLRQKELHLSLKAILLCLTKPHPITATMGMMKHHNRPIARHPMIIQIITIESGACITVMLIIARDIIGLIKSTHARHAVTGIANALLAGDQTILTTTAACDITTANQDITRKNIIVLIAMVTITSQDTIGAAIIFTEGQIITNINIINDVSMAVTTTENADIIDHIVTNRDLIILHTDTIIKT